MGHSWTCCADGDAVPTSSLVPELDGVVVGHVVCSSGSVDGRQCLGLGPVGVLPEHQDTESGPRSWTP